MHAALMEMDFGRWDGASWADIPRSEIDAWCGDLADVAPGGGETLRQFLARAQAWSAAVPVCVVVAHAGWMLARQWTQDHPNGDVPAKAADWPLAPAHQTRWMLR